MTKTNKDDENGMNIEDIPLPTEDALAQPANVELDERPKEEAENPDVSVELATTARETGSALMERISDAEDEGGRQHRSIAEWNDANLDDELAKNAERVRGEKDLRKKLATLANRPIDELRRFVFKENDLESFSAKDLMEISNRFRLQGSPDDQIALYERSTNGEFRDAARVQEFYALALIRAGRTGKAIEQLQQMILDGRGNSLVFGTLGDALTDLGNSARKFAASVRQAEGDPALVPAADRQKFRNNFGFDPLSDDTADDERRREFESFFGMSIPRSAEDFEKLSNQNLRQAEAAYRQGFLDGRDLFTGMGLLRRMNDRRASLRKKRALNTATEAERLEIGKLDRRIDDLQRLQTFVAENEGGGESLEYWTQGSRLELMAFRGEDESTLNRVLGNVLATADAPWKLRNTRVRINRLEETLREEKTLRNPDEHPEATDAPLRSLNYAKRQLERIESLLIMRDEKRQGILSAEDARQLEEQETQLRKEFPLEKSDAPPKRFLQQTFNFRGLVGSTVPQYIPGGIGRVGARVPDIMFNREDGKNARLISGALGLGIEGEATSWTLLEKPAMKELIGKRMREAIGLIHTFVRTQLNTASLQDLKYIDHKKFDELSDALIRLSGINPSKATDKQGRIGTRSVTNITAALLAGLGDCRETAYAVGSIFTAYQKVLANELIDDANHASYAGETKTFEYITNEALPEVMRYQVRAAHVGVYAPIEMNGLYDSVRLSETDPTGRERVLFGLAQKDRAKATMSPYEFGDAYLEVRYIDGRKTFVKPQWEQYEEGGKKQWRPKTTPDMVPEIPDAKADWSNIESVTARNKVEEHTMTFLHIAGRDGEDDRVELADGFYNEKFRERGDDPQYVSPYAFGSGTIDVQDLETEGGMLRAGTRTVINQNENKVSVPVYIQMLGFSKTDYMRSLGEGDIEKTGRILGNTINTSDAAAIMMSRMGPGGTRLETENDRAMDRIRTWHTQAA